MEIRTASHNDKDAIAVLEAVCFPESEAATPEQFQERLRHFADHFLVMTDRDRIIAFINGFAADDPDLKDEMYADASMHNENGQWQMIFGLAVDPEYRRRGYAAQLMKMFADTAKKQGRKGLVLACREKLVRYYEKFGFVSEGLSASEHGGTGWHQMRLTFRQDR